MESAVAAGTLHLAGLGACSATGRGRPGNGGPERCSVKDPTTNGCLTPRTLHALKTTQAAGFTRHG